MALRKGSESVKKKLSLKQRISITARGFGILDKYCPGLVKGKAVSALIASLQPFASIWFSAQIINELSSDRNLKTLLTYVAAVVAINFAAVVLKSILERINTEKQSIMWNFFGKVFSDKQMSMDFVDLENASIRHQKSKAEENLFTFGNGLGQLVWNVSGLVESAINVSVSIAMIVTLFTSKAGQRVIDSPVWIAVLLLTILFGGICNSEAFVREHEVFEKWAKGTLWHTRVFSFYGWNLYSSLERAKDLRIYEQNFIADKVLEKLVEKDRQEDKYIFQMSAYQAAACTIIGITHAAGYLFVALKAFFGAFGVGSIVQYVGALGRLGEGIQGILFAVSDNAVYCVHLQGLFDFLDIPNKKYQGTLPIEKRRDHEYIIAFKNVSFRYPETDRYVLKNLNLTFRAGKRMAVVGMNGSGKTTMIKLLCRLYDPTEGVITLNGIDIKKYDYEEYMSIFSVVFQDFRLFSFSLGQNVAASARVDLKRAEDCLRGAGLSGLLDSMPKGLDTPLYKDFEECGVEISGGEAQKIALARALYKDAPFVILDEPTAALDPIAEFEIYSKFDEIVGNKTAVYISHRLSSCRFCDEIAVFHEGELIQHGSHETLVGDTGGKYFQLWRAQAQYYEREEKREQLLT